MNPDKQPTTSPAPSTPPGEAQSPIMNAIGSAKKKSRKKLIIGIIAGSTALIAIIVGLLLYFLVLKNPQRVIEESVANAIMAKNYTTEARLVITDDKSNQKTIIKLKAANTEKSSEVQADVDIDTEIAEKKTKLTISGVNVRYVEGQMYVKVDNIRKAAEDIANIYVDTVERMNAGLIDGQQVQELRAHVTKTLDGLIKEFGDKWIKLPLDDSNQSDDAKCFAGILGYSKQNETQREEIIKAYRGNNFLKVKNDLGEKDGLHGFEIDLGPDTVDKRKAFVRALTEGSNEKLKNCDKFLKEFSKENTNISLKMWIDTEKKQIRRIEVNSDNNNIKGSFEAGIMYDNAKDVAVPEESKDVKEITDEIKGLLEGPQDSADQNEA